MGRNDFCFCGSEKKTKKCHPDINEQSIAARLLRLYNEIDQTINNYYMDSHHTIQCAEGCSECCYTDFPLSDLEFNMIIYEIRKWSKANIESLIYRAGLMWDKINEKYPDYVDLICKNSTGREDLIYQSLLYTPDQTDFRCPFLDEDDLCLIYNVRPVICRTHGMAYFDIHLGLENAICSKIGSKLKAMSWQTNLTHLYEKIMSLSIIEIPGTDYKIDIRTRPIFYLAYQRSNLYLSSGLPQIFQLQFEESESFYINYHISKYLR